MSPYRSEDLAPRVADIEKRLISVAEKLETLSRLEPRPSRLVEIFKSEGVIASTVIGTLAAALLGLVTFVVQMEESDEREDRALARSSCIEQDAKLSSINENDNGEIETIYCTKNGRMISIHMEDGNASIMEER